MYRLIRTPEDRAEAPVLDATQQSVVDHPGGPLLVLAGPGTGKTTTLVESVVDRIERRGAHPDSVLVLTFSRKAAADLRGRIAARLGRTMVTPLAMTFHAFCYALVRRFADRLGDGVTGLHPVRLLTGPEQDFRVRETLQGSLDTDRAHWPESLGRAFPTRAFASEVRAVLAKARQLGMDPEDVVAAGEAAGREEWVSVGQFFEEYLDVLDAEGVLDYAELVHRCRILLADPDVARILRTEISCVFVDEYQDTDPSQVRLLQTVAGFGGDVVVVGDPDQSIYAFRGAEARGILDFPDLFRTADGEPAPVVALGQTRRFGRQLLTASRSIANRLGMPRALPAEVFTTFRNPVPTPGRPPGKVEILTCSSAGAEAEHIAEILRSAHLRDGLAWDEMAVLVRSGRQSIPPLTRALVAAGVPVEVAGDEIPLGSDPAVRPLLLGLQVATRGRHVTADEAQGLLASPLGGMDAMATRRLGRALRASERAELAGSGLPRPSSELVAAALRHPELLEDCEPGPEVESARRLAGLLVRCESAIRSGGTAEEALWLLWQGTRWPGRLQAEAARGGDTGRRANRDLDAVCALFEIAARSEEVSGLRGVTGFLAEVEGQQIPADTLRESDLRGAAVRVLTAHRSKGLEWELVVVAGVQEGNWPDVRRRGSLLEADRLGRHGVSEPVPTAVRIAEERRLFYVACTRARSRLVVTAVAGTEGEGDQPSRFLTELGAPVHALPGRPRRPLSLASLVGELRAVSVDPEAAPALRAQAAARLARLADAVDGHGHALVGAARPEQWWGMRPLSDAPEPVVAAGSAVHLSGSQLASVLACPRQWFLARKAQAETARSTAASFGSVVHVLAEHGARTADPGALSDHLEAVWDQLDFDAKWLSAVERVEAESALERFVTWQEARGHLELLGTEVPFTCEVEVTPGERVHLTGTADRVERDPDGRIRIVDFKTSKTAPTATDVALQDQLGVYQLAVQQGAYAEVAGPGARPAGAELVYLRLGEGTGTFPRVFQQASLDDLPFPPGTEPSPGAGLSPGAELASGSEPLSRTGEPGSDLSATPPGGVVGEASPTWVHGRLGAAARVIRSERFEARLGSACRFCRFRGSCPAQPGGQQVVS
ncbi:MAG: putative ATP-dependent helicase [Friedmanniella sp.]|nr:putative ATP-dependent helicase [Friedmanniella sp.]